MSVDDFCRLCNENLRINGTLSNTKKIFDLKKVANEKSVEERLIELGLPLSKDSSRSGRICRSCLRLLRRIENDFAVFRRWQEAEKETGSAASTSAVETPLPCGPAGFTRSQDQSIWRGRSEKRDKEPRPSEMPRSVKRLCPKPPAPIRAPAQKLLRPATETPAGLSLSEGLYFWIPLSSSMMQAGVCLRQDTETTLPELTEKHRIRLKEEELSGLESVHMAESETECAAPGLNTLEPECVTAHSGVSDVHHTHLSLIKTEADLGSTHTGDLKTESLDSTELGYVAHLHPDQIKTEADDGGYLKGEHASELQDVECVDIKSDQIKCESSESSESDLMNAEITGAGVDHSDQEEPQNHHLTAIEEEAAGLCDRSRIIRKNGNDQKPKGCRKMNVIIEPMSNCGENHGLNLINNNAILRSKSRTPAVEKPYKCKHCQRCFHLKSVLYCHQKIHTDKKPYKCPQCGKYFSKVCHLNIHLRIHTGEKPYECSHRGKCFSTVYEFHNHQRIHTGEKPYKCILCGMCFSQISNLHRHQRIHTGEKPYKCIHCGMCFSQISNLGRHQRIHTGEKPYQCSRCGKCFSHLSTFNVHKVMHSGEKPYHCTQCGKRFFHARALNCHKMFHSGEKPYKCTECGKCFVTVSHLNRHQRVHTGEKPYACLQCGKSFSTASHLNRHKRTHRVLAE